MAKIQNLSELSQSFSFKEYDFFDFYRRSFECSELGRMKKLLPLREMADSFGLVSGRRAPKREGRSRTIARIMAKRNEMEPLYDVIKKNTWSK